MVQAGALSVLLFLIGKITVLYKFLLKIIREIAFLKMLHWIFCSKNKITGNFWQGLRLFSNTKYRNWFVQDLLWFLFFQLQNYRTLQVPALKLFKRFLFLKCYTTLLDNIGHFLERSEIFQPYEREKLVYAGAPLVLLFWIGKLHNLTCSCSKLFWKFPLLKCYTVFSVSKTTILEIFSKK